MFCQQRNGQLAIKHDGEEFMRVSYTRHARGRGRNIRETQRGSTGGSVHQGPGLSGPMGHM